VNRLAAAVYPDLRSIAGRAMSQERPSHTLQPTALVNEYYMRMFHGSAEGQLPANADTWKDRAHFYAIAARQMRQILVDHARRHKAGKRGNALRVALNEEIDAAPGRDHSIEDIDSLLQDLEKRDPQAAHVVELKFFGGLTDDEVVEVLRSNRSRVRRDWEFARSWLFRHLNGKLKKVE